MLVLRFVVEQDIAIEKMLVVTFTKAATEELKDRCDPDWQKQASFGRAHRKHRQHVLDWLANSA